MPRKTGAEARAERLTWFAMVLVFILISFDEDVGIPGYIVPFALSFILFVSGMYQYRRNWRVGPVTWIVCGILFVIGFLNAYWVNLTRMVSFPLPFVDPILISLIATVVVILYGVIANEG